MGKRIKVGGVVLFLLALAIAVAAAHYGHGGGYVHPTFVGFSSGA